MPLTRAKSGPCGLERRLRLPKAVAHRDQNPVHVGLEIEASRHLKYPVGNRFSRLLQTSSKVRDLSQVPARRPFFVSTAAVQQGPRPLTSTRSETAFRVYCSRPTRSETSHKYPVRDRFSCLLQPSKKVRDLSQVPGPRPLFAFTADVQQSPRPLTSTRSETVFRVYCSRPTRSETSHKYPLGDRFSCLLQPSNKVRDLSQVPARRPFFVSTAAVQQGPRPLTSTRSETVFRVYCSRPTRSETSHKYPLGDRFSCLLQPSNKVRDLSQVPARRPFFVSTAAVQQGPRPLTSTRSETVFRVYCSRPTRSETSHKCPLGDRFSCLLQPSNKVRDLSQVPARRPLFVSTAAVQQGPRPLTSTRSETCLLQPSNKVRNLSQVPVPRPLFAFTAAVQQSPRPLTSTRSETVFRVYCSRPTRCETSHKYPVRDRFSCLLQPFSEGLSRHV